MIIINQWYGQLGNNILQVLRAISAAKSFGHNCICLPPHPIITSSKIFLDIPGKKNDSILRGTFFDLGNYHLDNPSTAELKSNANSYKKKFFPDWFFSSEGIDTRLFNPDFIAAHVRGGDVFNRRPHPMYVQPPLIYYQRLHNEFQSILLVKQDFRNPIVGRLVKNDRVYDISTSEVQDFRSLMKARNIAFSASTFSFAAYLLNDTIERVILPYYFFKALPEGDWPTMHSLSLIELPEYIGVGKWKNNFFQRQKMLFHRNLVVHEKYYNT